MHGVALYDPAPGQHVATAVAPYGRHTKGHQVTAVLVVSM